MSWINFYMKKRIRYPYDKQDLENLGEIVLEDYFDFESYRSDIEWLNKLELNKGKFVPVIDDETGESLSEKEIELLESNKTASLIIPIVDETKIRRQVIYEIKRKRRYKPRIPISTELRKAVYELFEKRCALCGVFGANQIHHIDHDPTNNNIKNLQLLCYEDHLKADGKKLRHDLDE